MIKEIYSETHDWIAFKHNKIPMTISLLKMPRGYAVHLDTDNNPPSQHLTLPQAQRLYRDLSERLWGMRIDADTGKVYAE